jgi:hypothetical protein
MLKAGWNYDGALFGAPRRVSEVMDIFEVTQAILPCADRSLCC